MTRGREPWDFSLCYIIRFGVFRKVNIKSYIFAQKKKNYFIDTLKILDDIFV